MREIEDLRSTLLSLSAGFGVRFKEFDEHFGEVTCRYNKASASLDRHRKEINSSESRIGALEKLVTKLQMKVCYCVLASSPAGSKGSPIPVEDSDDGLEYLNAPVAEDGPGPQDIESRCFTVREEIAPPATTPAPENAVPTFICLCADRPISAKEFKSCCSGPAPWEYRGSLEEEQILLPRELREEMGILEKAAPRPIVGDQRARHTIRRKTQHRMTASTRSTHPYRGC